MHHHVVSIPPAPRHLGDHHTVDWQRYDRRLLVHVIQNFAVDQIVQRHDWPRHKTSDPVGHYFHLRNNRSRCAVSLFARRKRHNQCLPERIDFSHIAHVAYLGTPRWLAPQPLWYFQLPHFVTAILGKPYPCGKIRGRSNLHPPPFPYPLREPPWVAILEIKGTEPKISAAFGFTNYSPGKSNEAPRHQSNRSRPCTLD